MRRSRKWAVAAVIIGIFAMAASGVSAYAAGSPKDAESARTARKVAEITQVKRAAVSRDAAASTRLRGPVQPRETAYPLPALPVTGTLDISHQSDFYYLDLAAGQCITLYLEGDPGTDFDLGLLDSDTTLVAASVATDYPELIAYKIPTSGAGTHYVWVNWYSGAGEYSLKYGIDNDSQLPGTTLRFPATPVGGMLDSDTDLFDSYSVYLYAGQTFTAVLDGAAGSDFDLELYPPGTTSHLAVWPVADTWASAAYPDTLTYVAPTTGTYYLVARTWLDTGTGWYRFTYSRPIIGGRFTPKLYVNSARLRRGQTLRYWGTVYPTAYSRYRMVQVQKVVAGRWREARWVKLSSAGKFPAPIAATYSYATRQTMRLYMPAYVDSVRGISYSAGYSAPRTINWY
jgi:hypothetical protein